MGNKLLTKRMIRDADWVVEDTAYLKEELLELFCELKDSEIETIYNSSLKVLGAWQEVVDEVEAVRQNRKGWHDGKPPREVA
jgi:hypothetical protein